MGFISVSAVLVAISAIALCAPFEFQTFPKYQNFDHPASQAIFRSLSVLSHLKAAESTEVPENIEWIFWLQANKKEFLTVYDRMKAYPTGTNTAILYSFLTQMIIHEKAAWPQSSGEEIDFVKNFLMKHRAEFEKEMKRLESGNPNEQEERDANLQLLLIAVEQQADTTPEVRKSTEGLVFSIASNTECVRKAYANIAGTQFTSGSQYLKAFLEEYAKCMYATTGETLEYFNAKNVLSFIETRMEKVDEVLEEFSTIPVIDASG